MIANLLIVTGFISGVFGMLDAFMSDQQKKSVEMLTLRAWYRLNNAKRVTTSDWLFRKENRGWLVGITVVIFAAFALPLFFTNFIRLDEDPWHTLGTLFVVLVFSILGAVVGRIVLLVVLNGKQGWIAAKVSLLALVLPAALYGFDKTCSSCVGHTNIAVELLYLTVMTVLAVPLVFLIIAALPVGVVRIAVLVLTVSEFVVRKIAEYPKGVVLAISTIVTGVGGVLKAFG
jgi:hypothetical protein